MVYNKKKAHQKAQVKKKNREKSEEIIMPVKV